MERKEKTKSAALPLKSKFIITILAITLLLLFLAKFESATTTPNYLNSKVYAGSQGLAHVFPPATPLTKAIRHAKASETILWQEVERAAVLSNQAGRSIVPVSYRTLRLNRDALARLLYLTPMEWTAAGGTQAVITLPMPDGILARFHVEESPIMEPELAARFPEIKTYKGQGIDDPTATARFDWMPTGFHAMVISAQATVMIEPYSKEDTNIYMSYYRNDMEEDVGHFQCLVPGDNPASTEMPNEQFQRANNRTSNYAIGTALRVYRLAVAATGEYAQTYGRGTVSGTLAAIATNINLVNAIYERELAIRLVLVNGEAAIIFTDAATDGYTNNDSNKLVEENQRKLDSIVGPGNYDIGFLFDSSPVGSVRFNIQGAAGGIGIVCVNGRKAQGVVVYYSTQPSDVEGVHSVAHEIGHQFGATHTFNGVFGGCGSNNRFAATAYEPGSGATVMSYGFLIPPDNGFLCGSEGLHSADVYFHAASIEQIVNYITASTGGACARQIATGNNAPSVVAGDNYNIPQSTPFALTATGSDQDGDATTYCWEEFDLGAAAPPDTDDGSRPIFRSFAPVTSPSRTFPQLADILTGASTFGESLPTTTRAMNFRVTVRDNRSGGGGVAISSMRVNVKSNSGPFIVTQPEGEETWTGGSLQTVTWDVANTSSSSVRCKDVVILLSTNGGITFPIVLARSTPNDGSEHVTVPNIPTNAARIKVEAIGNIFFNISKANHTIASGVNCSFNVGPINQEFNSTASNGSVNVMTDRECSWVVSNVPSWIDITSGDSGSGSGVVNYSVADNTGAARTGAMTIAGQIIVVTQAAAHPKIISAKISGKKLFIFGEGFDAGAVILLNGKQQKTTNNDADPNTRLVARKAGKKTREGDKLQVRNADGRLSQELIFTGS
jgi:hypothetical protein